MGDTVIDNREGPTQTTRYANNHSLLAFALAPTMTYAQASTGVPVIKMVKEESSIKFNVKASVALEGTFDKWDAKITMTSADVESGVLDIKIKQRVRTREAG